MFFVFLPCWGCCLMVKCYCSESRKCSDWKHWLGRQSPAWPGVQVCFSTPAASEAQLFSRGARGNNTDPTQHSVVPRTPGAGQSTYVVLDSTLGKVACVC